MDKPTQNKANYLCLPKRNKGAIDAKFRKIVIDSNRYKVDISKLSSLCIFAIKFTPEIQEDQKLIKEEMLVKITPQIRQFIDEPIIKDNLIFTHKMPKLSDKTIVYDNFIITIREVNRFDAKENPQMLLYFLSNVMRKVMQKIGYVEVGRSKKFINMKNCLEVEDVLVFCGFKMAFELLQNGYYLTVDTTKKIVRNQSVLQYITYLYKSNPTLQRDEKRELVKKALVGRIVMTNYGKTRYLKVEDVFFIDLTQVIVQSCQMSLLNYYINRYDLQIKNLKQPLLYANAKRTNIKTYLIPQLCLMTGIPEDFDESKNKCITEAGKQTANERKTQIQNFVGQMNKMQGDVVFQTLGVKISSVSQKVQAKLIPVPKIILGEGKSIPAGKQLAFSLYDNPIYKVKEKPKLALITFDGIDSSAIIEYFTKTFKTLKVKIEISLIKADNFNYKRGIDSISTLIEKAKDQEQCTICLLLIPNKMRNFYIKIKQLTLLEKEIPCQVVLQATLKNKNIQSVALKIFLQILAKTGNTLWASAPASRKQKIMFVAYHSCDLGKLKSNGYTVGISATYDDLYTQIFSKTSKYTKQHQQIQCMRELLLEAILHYKKMNGFVPQNIIVLENEKPPRTAQLTIEFCIQPCIKHLEEVYGQKRPKLTYIIVRKSLHDRFFRAFEGNYKNPPIGTLINTHLTASKFQFYMISHDICKKGGSIIPLNYKVIFSDSDIQEGVIYCLLYSQCFSYPNYTGAIRQPSLLQHVTRCTKFGAQVLSNAEVNPQFRCVPYYI